MRGRVMLKRLGKSRIPDAVKICEANFPLPFASGLEYSAPARGVFNIVHTGMLIPEIHEIFVCAQGCLRGVVLTAAEMGAQERFSTVTVRENNVLDGDMEELLIEGVADILTRLPELPPAVLVYTSCIHHFMGCDLNYCYDELKKRFPTVEFVDCYMNPIMRKSGLTPDQIMRKQLYGLLTPRESDGGINVLGNNYSTDDESDLVEIIRKSKRPFREVTRCGSYSEYKEMAGSSLDLTYNSAAIAAGEALGERLGIRHLHLPFSFSENKIIGNLSRLASELNVDYDFSAKKEKALDALSLAKKEIGERPIAVDYTAVLAPLSLIKLLSENGFNVRRFYADSFMPDEKEEFDWIVRNLPELEIFPTVRPEMRVAERNEADFLAIGQKAAYFTGTKNFVNIVESAGMYGFYSIEKLARLMTDAQRNEKEAETSIQQKGWGCNCCL